MSHHVRFSEPDSGTQLDVVDAVVTVKVEAPDTDGIYELFELAGCRRLRRTEVTPPMGRGLLRARRHRRPSRSAVVRTTWSPARR